MKKLLIGLVALSAVSMAAGETQNTTQFDTNGMYLNFRLGLDRGGHYISDGDDYKGDYSYETDDFGGEIAVEGLIPLNDMFHLGLGVAFQSHAAGNEYFSGYDSDDKRKDNYYNSVPVYVTGKFYIPTETVVKPYLKANLGYSFNTEFDKDADVDNGFYYAAGLGVEYNNFNVDFMYAKTKGEVKLKDSSYDVAADYARFVLSVGYKLGL